MPKDSSGVGPNDMTVPTLEEMGYTDPELPVRHAALT